jgi:hypothetical protein
LQIGQYANYGINNSNTETLFKLHLSNNKINLHIESGKKLKEKETNLIIDQYNFDIVNEKLTQNNQIIANLSNSDVINDHYILFDNVKNNIVDNFISLSEVKNIWNLLDRINQYRLENQIKLEIY